MRRGGQQVCQHSTTLRQRHWPEIQFAARREAYKQRRRFGELHERCASDRNLGVLDRSRGTFTDIVARDPSGALVTHKLLSENPSSIATQRCGIRHLLDLAAGQPIP